MAKRQSGSGRPRCQSREQLLRYVPVISHVCIAFVLIVSLNQNRPPRRAAKTGRPNRPPKEASRTGHHVTIGDEIRPGQFLHRFSAPAGDALDTSIEPPKQATKKGRQNRPPNHAIKTGRQNRPPKQAALGLPGVREHAALPFPLYHSHSSKVVFFLPESPLSAGRVR